MPNSDWQKLINELNIPLPSDFNFEENQQRLGEFAIQDWYCAVYYRRLTSFMIPSNVSPAGDKLDSEKREYLDLRISNQLKHTYPDRNDGSWNYGTDKTSLVRPMTLLDLRRSNEVLVKNTARVWNVIENSPCKVIQRANLLEPLEEVIDYVKYSDSDERLERNWALSHFARTTELRSLFNWGNMIALRKDEREFLEIDFSGPDSLIMEQFKGYLDFVRLRNETPAESSKIPKRKLITESTFRSWRTSNVLLYIDISQIVKLNNLTIKDEDYGKILFPEEYDVSLVDRVRSTVRNHAKALLSDATEASLQAQARADNG